jgi:hypothetical protein
MERDRSETKVVALLRDVLAAYSISLSERGASGYHLMCTTLYGEQIIGYVEVEISTPSGTFALHTTMGTTDRPVRVEHDARESYLDVSTLQECLREYVYTLRVERSCGYCAAIRSGMRVCSECGSVQYCDRECQVRHWGQEHGGECASYRERRLRRDYERVVERRYPALEPLRPCRSVEKVARREYSREYALVCVKANPYRLSLLMELPRDVLGYLLARLDPGTRYVCRRACRTLRRCTPRLGTVQGDPRGWWDTKTFMMREDMLVPLMVHVGDRAAARDHLSGDHRTVRQLVGWGSWRVLGWVLLDLWAPPLARDHHQRYGDCFRYDDDMGELVRETARSGKAECVRILVRRLMASEGWIRHSNLLQTETRRLVNVAASVQQVRVLRTLREMGVPMRGKVLLRQVPRGTHVTEEMREFAGECR